MTGKMAIRTFPTAYKLKAITGVSCTVIASRRCGAKTPGQQRFRRRQPCDVADDVGVREITAHSSTLRPVSNGRTGAISAPTRGERRSASRMPPFLGASPEIA
jgi:hypothetical protein